ncbi:hypothetical protein ACFL5O_05340 [Myxococcota bacterium]
MALVKPGVGLVGTKKRVEAPRIDVDLLLASGPRVEQPGPTDAEGVGAGPPVVDAAAVANGVAGPKVARNAPAAPFEPLLSTSGSDGDLQRWATRQADSEGARAGHSTGGGATVASREPGDGSRRSPIDLGLDGSIARDTLRVLRHKRARERRSHAAGMLEEGLAGLDAERGMSRSGAAIHAGYAAARRLAPADGIGVFDVLADERGVVLSVALVSSGPDASRWEHVGDSLRAALEGRRLRVPPRAKGLLTRQRIERGRYAIELSERDTISRGAAIRQGKSDRGGGRHESTRASLEPGVISPSAGLDFKHRAHPTRVAVVFERPL